MLDRILATPEVFLAAIAGMVWLVRLEGKMIIVQRDLARLEVKHEALDNKIVEKLSLIEKSLARLEGRLRIESGKET
jgi:hypothetical protein